MNKFNILDNVSFQITEEKRLNGKIIEISIDLEKYYSDSEYYMIYKISTEQGIFEVYEQLLKEH